MSKQIKDRTYRPLVYIASPLSGDVEVNTERARAFCRFALEKGQIVSDHRGAYYDTSKGTALS